MVRLTVVVFEVRYFDLRTRQPTRTLRTEVELDRWMDRLRADEAEGRIPAGYCDSVVIVERPDDAADGVNGRTGY